MMWVYIKGSENREDMYLRDLEDKTRANKQKLKQKVFVSTYKEQLELSKSSSKLQ